MTKKATDFIAAVPWAIDPSWLQSIYEIAGRDYSDMEAVERIRADRLARSENAGARDGVAIIDIAGPIFRHANIFTEISGATSIESVGRDLAVAVDDPTVKSILLNVDSPGGMVSGTNELADMIKATDKPVTAYVGNMAASAAYWIAAAADEIVIDPTAQLGSIGVVQTHIDYSKQDKARGIEETEIVSSQSPHKRPDIQTDEGRAVVQRHVDDLAAVFVSSVAENRGVTAETVMSEFGGGGMLVGEKAIAAGMADRLGNFEEVLVGLADDHRGGAISGGAAKSKAIEGKNAMAKEKTETGSSADASASMAIISAESIAADHPDIAAHFRTEGATAERERILAIEGAALPGHDKLVATLKADGITSAGDAALQIMAAEKTKMTARLEDQKAAGALTEDLESSSSETGEESNGLDPNAPIEDRAKAAWDKDSAIRDEFQTFATYLAYAKAQESDQVKILNNKK